MMDNRDKDYFSLKNFKVNCKDLKDSVLGKGSNATVYSVEHWDTKEKFAIKSVKLKDYFEFGKQWKWFSENLTRNCNSLEIIP